MAMENSSCNAIALRYTDGGSSKIGVRSFHQCEKKNRTFARSSIGSGIEDSARESMEEYVRRVMREGIAPNIMQHIVGAIIRNESPPFIGGEVWDDFVVSRRRHLNARQQYERFPFGQDVESPCSAISITGLWRGLRRTNGDAAVIVIRRILCRYRRYHGRCPSKARVSGMARDMLDARKSCLLQPLVTRTTTSSLRLHFVAR